MNIIFVCTGNTCRSPMAEYYLKSKNLNGVNVISRGFGEGEPVSSKSVAVMAEIGIDISNHISSRITESEAENADAIICMTESHRQLLIYLGVNPKRIYVLGGGIPDPFGGDLEVYRNCRNKILMSIDSLIQDGFFDGIKISIATKNDIPDIANIENRSFSTPWSEKSILESMNAKTVFYTAHSGGKSVGYIGLSKISGEGYVTNIAVLPEYRRRGIGQKLIEYMINDCKEQLEFISLEVRVSNNAAVSLYKKFGFERVGLRKNFYTKPTEDAVIMTKKFI